MAPRKNIRAMPSRSGLPEPKRKYPLTLVLILPAICIIFAGLYTIKPQLVDTIVPLRGYLPWSASITDFLPPHPKSLFEAFSFGQLDEKLSQLEIRNENTTEAITQILFDAAKIAKRPVTIEELRAVQQIVIDLDNETSIVTKVWGFFTFVNLIWIISFIGLLVTIIPCLLVCSAPLGKLIFAIGEILMTIFLSKIAFVIYEISSWVFVCFWTIAAHQYSSDVSYLLGFFAVGWYIFFLYCWLYYHGVLEYYSSHYRNGVSLSHITVVIYMATGLFSFPLTFLFQSTLIGWVSVICLYTILGFSVIGGGLCYYIGFGDKDTLLRCVVTSFFFILFYSAYKIAGLPVEYLVPFASPLMILGNTVYFLGVLIASSRFQPRRDIEQYVMLQILMIFSIFAAFVIGAVFAIYPMINVASVFLVLYIFEKVVELDFWYKAAAGFWILGFLISASLFVLAFYLHGHPNIIVSLFDSSWLIVPPTN